MTGSKPEPLFDARISAYAGCGHAVAFARGRFVPRPAVSRCSNVRGAKLPLLDHLIGAQRECRRDGKTEGLCGLHVDHQLELRRRLNGKVARLLAPQDAVDIRCRSAPFINLIGSVGEQSALGCEVPEWIDRRQAVRLYDAMRAGRSKATDLGTGCSMIGRLITAEAIPRHTESHHTMS